MRIAIGSDHAGFDQKARLADYLTEHGHTVADIGCTNGEDSVDYPDFALVVGNAVSSGDADFGVLVCGTGIGMAIAANKVAGVRAANVTDPGFAKLAREHNDANIVTLSARFVPLQVNEEILDGFLATPFAGARHAGRVAKITAAERP
jgi:ribose 5-phosphate isomerase B